MGRRISIVLEVGLLVGAGLFVLARQQTALAQARQAEELQREKTRNALDMLSTQAIDAFERDRKGLRWEYKVFTLAERDEEANERLAKMADDGWEFVTIVPSAAPQSAMPRLLFKRVKK